MPWSTGKFTSIENQLILIIISFWANQKVRPFCSYKTKIIVGLGALPTIMKYTHFS